MDYVAVKLRDKQFQEISVGNKPLTGYLQLTVQEDAFCLLEKKKVMCWECKKTMKHV